MTSDSLLILVIFTISAAVASIHNDVIVAAGDRIELLTNGSHSLEIQLPQYNASTLVALAYDPSSKQLFFSDKRNKRGHIFSIGFDDTASFGLVKDLVERGNNESVEGLTFDPVDNALLWTDGLKQSIRRVKLGNAETIQESNSVEVLHLLHGDKPRGLVSDPCTRMVYWTNWNMERPSIERSFLDGSHRKIIVQQDLKMPHGLGIDVKQQMIYWANNLRFGSFVIERSRIDGSDRQKIYEGKGQFIFGLTVGDDYIYWTDWDQKTLFSLPKDGSSDGPVALRNYQHKPMGVVVLKREPITCQIFDLPSEEPVTIQSEVIEPEIAPDPQRLCAGYCFNNGECLVVDSDISCLCPEPFSGDRCQLIERKESENTTAEFVGSCFTPLYELDETYLIAIISLGILSTVLLFAVIFLGIRVWKLTKRSRRKRRVLMKEKSLCPVDRVINIEDCCNMNICETPCTEPPSESTRMISDKAKLLKCEF